MVSESSAAAGTIARSARPLIVGIRSVSDDREDAALAARGDVLAFERIYRRHASRVRSTASWLLGTRDVDDAVQEVFIRLWKKIHLFRGSSSFASWFGRVTVHVVLRHRSRIGRWGDRADTPEELAKLPSRNAPVDLTMEIEMAVATLPPRAREVFVLHDVQGLSHDEIGALLGITASTSRSQLTRARLALRHWFTEDEARDP